MRWRIVLLPLLVVELFSLSTAQAAPITVTFQQGVDGYTGTQDITLDTALLLGPFGGGSGLGFGSSLWVQGGGLPTRQILIRFDDIIGGALGQVASGSSISDAKMKFRVDFHSLDELNANAILFNWDDNFTLENNPIQVIQTDDIQARSTPFDTPGTLGGQFLEIDMTSLVQEWVDGSLINNGILIHAPSALFPQLGSLYSSNFSLINDRPSLSITYESNQGSEEGVPSPGALSLLGLGLIGLGVSRRTS